jgi:hypothetical protein
VSRPRLRCPLPRPRKRPSATTWSPTSRISGNSNSVSARTTQTSGRNSRTPSCPRYTASPPSIGSGTCHSTSGSSSARSASTSRRLAASNPRSKDSVLFRHRLLLKPGGFEGFSPLPEALNADHLAATQGPEREETHLRRTPLALPTPRCRTPTTTLSPAAMISSASCVRCLLVSSKSRVYAATASSPRYVPASGNSGRRTKRTCGSSSSALARKSRSLHRSYTAERSRRSPATSPAQYPAPERRLVPEEDAARGACPSRPSSGNGVCRTARR